MKIKHREELIAKQEEYRASLNSQRKQILICAGTGCVAGGSLEIYAKMKDIIESKGLKCALVLEKDPLNLYRTQGPSSLLTPVTYLV